MKGTRLWQAPGSPIIQGRSRNARPFWEPWLLGACVALAVIAVGGLAIAMREPGTALGDVLGAVAFNLLVPAIPGAAIGSAGGIAAARGMGWRPDWIAGGIAGVAAAVVVVAVV
ncbi:MAG: hypothetical protein HGB10_00130 [Coriobacteriia bacterium]|nr:hypothetical protein [Coriobacteriia bacterium]